MPEEKQETIQEPKLTRRALLSLIAATVIGGALITKVTASDHEEKARTLGDQWDPCAPQEDKCRPWKFT